MPAATQSGKRPGAVKASEPAGRSPCSGLKDGASSSDETGDGRQQCSRHRLAVRAGGDRRQRAPRHASTTLISHGQPFSAGGTLRAAARLGGLKAARDATNGAAEPLAESWRSHGCVQVADIVHRGSPGHPGRVWLRGAGIPRRLDRASNVSDSRRDVLVASPWSRRSPASTPSGGGKVTPSLALPRLPIGGEAASADADDRLPVRRHQLDCDHQRRGHHPERGMPLRSRVRGSPTRVSRSSGLAVVRRTAWVTSCEAGVPPARSPCAPCPVRSRDERQCWAEGHHALPHERGEDGMPAVGRVLGQATAAALDRSLLPGPEPTAPTDSGTTSQTGADVSSAPIPAGRLRPRPRPRAAR